MSLVVTGSIGIDTVESPLGSATNVLGGSAVYFSAAASFFSPVRLVAAVGDDFPDDAMETFKRFKIDASGLERRAGSKTFRWHGRYRQNMNERDTVKVDLNVLGEKQPPIPPHFKDSRLVFLANTHPTAQLEILEHFPERTLAVADTMDLWINTAQAELRKLMRHIDGLVLNDSEARLLTGESNMVVASKAIVEMGPKFVVIKKGEHGCLLNHTDGVAVMHAYPAANVVDPTGAGDSFAGGMMGYLATSQHVNLATIKRAMAYGTIVASFAIEAFSLNRLMQISRKDIDQRLNEYADCVRFDVP